MKVLSIVFLDETDVWGVLVHFTKVAGTYFWLGLPSTFVFWYMSYLSAYANIPHWRAQDTGFSQ
jgi:hypothetical protein